MCILISMYALMGVILSRFRLPGFKSKSSEDRRKELEKINEEISFIEKSTNALILQYRTVIEFIVTYSRMLYVLVGCVFFFSTLPTSVLEYVFLGGPLMIFHVLVWVFKGALKWYFDQEIQQNEEQLRVLRTRKKAILSEVKETTKFKEAKEIIEEYGHEKRFKPDIMNNFDVQRETLGFNIENKRSYMDRLTNYIFGEEKKNALICSYCYTHNGMALEEEFDYIGFRCCHCFLLNLPQKQKQPASQQHSNEISPESTKTENWDLCLRRTKKST